MSRKIRKLICKNVVWKNVTHSGSIPSIMQKEIEIKARITNLEIIKNALEKLGCVFTPPKTQDDTIFINFTGNYAKFMPGTNFLRIRKTNGKILFTLKQAQANELDCIEKEFEISNAEACADALALMGYLPKITVHKTRMKTKYHDMEICLDEVKDLGSFIEVEKMATGDGEKVQEELFTFLEQFGITRADRVMHGYDTLLHIQQNKNRS